MSEKKYCSEVAEVNFKESKRVSFIALRSVTTHNNFSVPPPDPRTATTTTPADRTKTELIPAYLRTPRWQQSHHCSNNQHASRTSYTPIAGRHQHPVATANQHRMRREATCAHNTCYFRAIRCDARDTLPNLASTQHPLRCATSLQPVFFLFRENSLMYERTFRSDSYIDETGKRHNQATPQRL